jgi:hypothetical protein
MEVVRKKRKGQKLKGGDLYKGTKIETQINHPPRKMTLFVKHRFPREEITNLTSNFT